MASQRSSGETMSVPRNLKSNSELKVEFKSQAMGVFTVGAAGNDTTAPGSLTRSVFCEASLECNVFSCVGSDTGQACCVLPSPYTGLGFNACEKILSAPHGSMRNPPGA